jgi:preprotein translocase subunit Sec61beta
MSEKQPSAKPARVPVKKVRLRISYIDPLSAVKTSFVLSIVFGIAMVFAIIFIWYLLNLSGSLDAATGLVSDVFGTGFNIAGLLSFSRVLSLGILVTVIQVVVWTLITGLFAIIYNIFAEFIGGVEVSLSDDI